MILAGRKNTHFLGTECKRCSAQRAQRNGAVNKGPQQVILFELGLPIGNTQTLSLTQRAEERLLGMLCFLCSKEMQR